MEIIPSASDWVAHAIVDVSEHPTDLRTIADWGRALPTAVSAKTIQGRCRLVDLGPKDAHRFARLFRVVCASQRGSYAYEDLLDVSTIGSLHGLLARGNLPLRPDRSITVQQFCNGQQLIRHESILLRIIALSNLVS